ncbi:MAG: Fe-S protein assembly co-chaperone HscB [Holosporaceae bacterium]|jgi:molecular chaperone HscB|nr:Fe-S protein assembly co-chaperone HscB [Holosporaceae bacterium]
MNYFDLLEIPVSYNLDESQLLRVYLQKQSRSHPDAGGTISNQDDSALLNAAYKTLMDPIKRAEHFLQVKNVNVDETSPEVAAKTFELQENYSALTSLEEKKTFQKNLKNQMGAVLESLSKTEGSLEDFCKIFNQLRFMGSFLEKISDDVYSGN